MPMIHIPAIPEAAVHANNGDKSQPPLRISRDSPFTNHSPYRVLYNDHIYATAAHLFEALKFLETRPDIAQMIQESPTPQDAYRLGSQYQQWARPDLSVRCLKSMEEVLMHKFRQHADLRKMLLATGNARIIYFDPDDVFWGVNAADEGSNNFGKALVHVRHKLQAETDDDLVGLHLW